MTRSTGRFPSAYRAACPSAEKFNKSRVRAVVVYCHWVFDTQILRHSGRRTHMRLISLFVLGVLADAVGTPARPADTKPLQKETTHRTQKDEPHRPAAAPPKHAQATQG